MPLKGPFQLTTPIIDKLVEGHVAGVYVVRRIEDTGDFAQWTGLLGRAEADLGAEIKKWIGTGVPAFPVRANQRCRNSREAGARIVEGSRG